MAKVLIMVRTSTEEQSIEDQHNEMMEFCKSEGFKPKDMVWIEEQGASAAKVDETYRDMIDRIKEKIDQDPEIKCFAVWHLNRAFRTESVYVELKSFLVDRKVQMICKNPYLHLLTPDGKVDPGMELAMGLLAILAKQDQEERKAKFKRAKDAMTRKGQYIGGNTIKYGYRVEGRNFVPDEKESAVVRTVFDMYSTGEYSTYTLSKELKERGYEISDGKVSKIIKCKAYTGDEVTERGMHYPPIISRELFDRCAEIRQNNKIDMKRGKNICLGAKLIKCHACGSTCTSNSKHYRCCKYSHHGPCKNGYALRQSVADELLYRFSFGLHLMWLMNLREGRLDEYKKDLKLLDEKIVVTQEKLERTYLKKDRIVESYLDGLIDKKNRDLRLKKYEDEVSAHREYLSQLQDKRRAIERLLKKDNGDTEENFIRAAEKMSTEDKYEIIHKHIESLVARQESYGIRDKRTHRDNAVHITITSVYGTTSEHLYFPKYYKNYNLYTWALNDDGSEGWCPDTLNREAVFAQPLE